MSIPCLCLFIGLFFVFLLDRECSVKGDAAIVIIGSNSTLVTLANTVCNGKAKTVATGFAGTREVGAVKTLKEMF